MAASKAAILLSADVRAGAAHIGRRRRRLRRQGGAGVCAAAFNTQQNLAESAKPALKKPP
ncbi:hypothetical protein [Mesorhizobium comanense]|uniref:hypothetical protein n=1 Tax=Mesorhizobium comanense TaxID=2502215 RepID=UPI0010F9BCB5|nr:hypothetical protein [Mesorhizobium comanense]